MESGLITLVSVALNILAGFIAPVVARRMASQQDRLRRAEDDLDVVGSGIRVIEKAVEENKDALSRSGAGNRVAQTIRNYGPAARQVVDAARSVAGTLRASATAVWEEEMVRREHRERAAREQARQDGQSKPDA